MRPPDVHNIINTVLHPLERRFGIATPEYINAFTPSPYSFPTVAALERHDFTKEYEFANLRVMFVSWINSDPVTRGMPAFKAPWDIEVVLRDSEVYRRLKAHPESAIRVALLYVFNQVQQGNEGVSSSLWQVKKKWVLMENRFQAVIGCQDGGVAPGIHELRASPSADDLETLVRSSVGFEGCYYV
jgi:hypothetical protein